MKSYDENYSSGEVSTLLANAGLKKRYEKVHKEIGEAKKDLERKLRVVAGFGEKSRENLDAIIEGIFGDSYYDALLNLEAELGSTSIAEYGSANYKIIFDPKVMQLLTDDKVGETVEEFAQKYDELTESSPILRKEFQYHNIDQVQQQLENNSFFDAGHSISLTDKNNNQKEELTTSKTFREKIDVEKARVLNDAELRKNFDAFNGKLKNKELQAFRDYITENQHLLPELRNLDEFRRRLWVQYLLSAKDEYDVLIDKYRTGQTELHEIVTEAAKNFSDWDTVIEDFNRRFLHLPFRLSVANKSDVILKGLAPSIEFIFQDQEDERIYAAANKKDLLRVLSTGEARALYILNIMFEVHTKWKYRQKTLFVFDDVADSFDYKNKFAIIDFLEDVVRVEDIEFLAIILTHNFDFLRTIESRMICPAHQCRLAFKANGQINLSDFKQSEIQNPFQKWQNRLAEPAILTAFIPFLRNVIEYTKGIKDADGNDNADYMTLTQMLHYKDETEALTLGDYKLVFEQTLTSVNFPDVDLTVGVLDYLFNTADNCVSADEGINLEEKIVLSIAIRIWAERYIIGKIRSNDTNYDTAKKQTGQLIQDFKDRFNNQLEEIKLLRRVNLITPSNVHINAFMYEPILDMGFGELVALYQETKEKLA